MPQNLSSAPLKAPVNVTWEITERCNLSCRHCLSADLRRREGGELDPRACEALIDELAAMQVFQINFGGGEPFLRADFLDILRYAQAKGIVTCVSTNGTLLTEALVDELAAMDLLFLQVSLDGARSETNDAIRGPGTFERILAGVELLRRRSFPDLSLNMVVTHVNFEEIAEFRRLASSLGARTRLSRFRPSGDGARVWDDYRLSREQLAWLARFLEEHGDVLTGDSFFALTNGGAGDRGLRMCGAARMTCAVGPDGSVFPCAFLCEPAFLAGNVVREPLGSIFEHAPIFRRLRDLEVEPCQACDRFSLCNGGCPAVAWFVTESLGLPDPECLRVAAPATTALAAARRAAAALGGSAPAATSRPHAEVA
ncbi:MAG: mycofactocin radical SAM maturase [Thermoleophilia bacterium]|nr:mycofactocin radical SAM maturase [Thermoleophilia bacterium]